MKYYVAYEVVGIEGTHEAGPYDFIEEAVGNQADIQGYEGVYNVRIVERESQAEGTQE